MDQQVHDFNKKNHYTPEHIKTWGLISSEGLTVEAGLMTSTLKLKRAQVEKQYADLISQMYETKGRHLVKMGAKIEVV
jgi:long-subunit acyl-CoA synthetase (AMP-forming)